MSKDRISLLFNLLLLSLYLFFFSSRRRHTRYWRDWSSDVCSSDLLTTNKTEFFLGAQQGEVMRLAEELGLVGRQGVDHVSQLFARGVALGEVVVIRSEERRVGKECRSLGRPRQGANHEYRDMRRGV